MADSGDTTVAHVMDLRPDVVLLDSALPNSLESVRAIRRQAGEVKVVALGLPEFDGAIIQCAEAGVAGYVTREGSRAELVATIRSVARGEALCSPRVAASLLQHVAALAAERPREPPHGLTARELQIVELIDEGLSNKQIAGRLYIEVPTVKSHVHSILEKLGVRRRGEAVARLRAVSL